MHPKTMEQFMNNKIPDDRKWEDLSEADWGVETFIPTQFEENNYKNHAQITDTKSFLRIITKFCMGSLCYVEKISLFHKNW